MPLLKAGSWRVSILFHSPYAPFELALLFWVVSGDLAWSVQIQNIRTLRTSRNQMCKFFRSHFLASLIKIMIDHKVKSEFIIYIGNKNKDMQTRPGPWMSTPPICPLVLLGPQEPAEPLTPQFNSPITPPQCLLVPCLLLLPQIPFPNGKNGQISNFLFTHISLKI